MSWPATTGAPPRSTARWDDGAAPAATCRAKLVSPYPLYRGDRVRAFTVARASGPCVPVLRDVGRAAGETKERKRSASRTRTGKIACALDFVRRTADAAEYRRPRALLPVP